MKKLSEKRKNYLKIHSLKCLRQKRKRNRQFRREKVRSLIGSAIRKFDSKPKPKKWEFDRSKPQEKVFKAPQNFSLINNTETVLKFISDFKNVKNIAKNVGTVILDMSNIMSTDIGALNMLLSAQYDVSFSGVSFFAKLPVDGNAKELFINSGYLAHMKKIGGGFFAREAKRDLILKLGKEHTKNESIGKAINEAILFLTGSSAHYTPVYSALMEMAPNSIEHAYEENKHWILGMHCDEETKKVSFTFTDNGLGIIKTLNRKYSEEFRDRLMGKNVQVIREAFDKRFGSRTEEINRNKGLPMIKKIFNKGKINNLILITDNVFFDFKTNDGVLLSTKFAGTFYSWEIDLKCIEHE